MNSMPEPVAAHFRHDAPLARMLRPIVNAMLPAGLTIVEVRSGAGKGLHLSIDARMQKYFWSGTHEPAVQQALLQILKPGMTFYDVGANLGFFSLIGSRLVGPSGKVHAFEPMTETRAHLETNIRANQAENIVVHGVALAAASGSALLHANITPGTWTLVAGKGKPHGMQVSLSTLDETVKFADIPDVVKIDTEGNELEVLRGGRELLSSKKPTIVFEVYFLEDS